jgi:hypothetical protein
VYVEKTSGNLFVRMFFFSTFAVRMNFAGYKAVSEEMICPPPESNSKQKLRCTQL